jgi:hypothetical protein
MTVLTIQCFQIENNENAASYIFSSSFQTNALAPTMAAEPALSWDGKICTLSLKIGSRLFSICSLVGLKM